MNKEILVSIDANSLIHFYRSGFKKEPGNVLDGVIDEFVMDEIQRNAIEVYNAVNELSWVRIVKQGELSPQQRQLYKSSFNNNRLLFDPQDWGEAHAIALGHALGAPVLLTDDTKKSGPRDYIIKGAIEGIDTIAFWEVVLMLSVAGFMDTGKIISICKQIIQTGYTNPPRIEPRQVLVESIDRLKNKTWFQDWLGEYKVEDVKLLFTSSGLK